MSNDITFEKRRSHSLITVDRRVTEDSRISFGARGLWTYLIGRSEGEKTTKEELLSQSPAGPRALQTLINELKSFGLLRIEMVRDKYTKKFAGSRWIIFEDFQAANEDAKKRAKKVDIKAWPQVRFRHDGKRTCAYIEDKEERDNISPKKKKEKVKHTSESRVPLDCVSSPPSDGPQKNPLGFEDILPKHDPEGFKSFIRTYPYPGAAIKPVAIAWDKLKPDTRTQSAIQTVVTQNSQTDKWRRGIGIPSPATFLKSKAWVTLESISIATGVRLDGIRFE